MSSLALQLFKMKHVDRSLSTERSQRIRASFLFDGRQAADMDNQTIFDIGQDGLSELRQIDHRFDVYAKTLFSEAAKDLDRILQTKDENKKLDENIKSFLFLLAPHFLTKPAGKVLEWLIRRFRIHEFNAKDLLASIFPYHETKAFLTMLTIITFDTEDLDLFGFLITQRKARRLLDRTTLMAQCLRDRSLFAFICTSVFDACKTGFGYPGIYSFYAMLSSQYIGQLGSIGNSTIQFFIPYILDGLNLTEKDAQLASYMVLGSLATKASFSPDALEKIMCAVAKRPADTRAMTMCLIQLLQAQAAVVDILSVRFLHILSNHKEFIQVYSSLTAEYSIELFSKPLIRSLSKHAFSDSKLSQFLSSLVTVLPIADGAYVCAALINEYIENGLAEGSSNDTNDSNVLEVISLLQLRYTQQLEDAIGAAASKINNNTEFSNEQKEDAHKLLYQLKIRGSSKNASEVISVKETSTTLYLSLNHSDPGVRLVAIKALGDLASGKVEGVSLSPEEISRTIVERLESEDNETAIQEILNLPLAKYVDSGELVGALGGLLTSDKFPVAHICKKAISHLFSIDFSSNDDIYNSASAVIFPYLLSFKETAVITKAIVEEFPASSFGKCKQWLSCLSSKKLTKVDVMSTEFNKVAVEVLAQGFAKNWKALICDSDGFLQTQLNSPILSAKATAIIIGSQALASISKSKDSEAFISVVSVLVSTITNILASSDELRLSKLDEKIVSTSCSNPDSSESLGRLFTSDNTVAATCGVCVSALFTVLSMLPSVIKLSANQWFAVNSTDSDTVAETRYRSLLQDAFMAIVSRPSELTSTDGIIISKILKLCLGSEWVQFLASLWLSDIAAVPKSRCLLAFSTLAQYSLLSGSDPKDETLDYQVVIPSLIVCLNDEDALVRGAAVACLKAICSLYPQVDKKGNVSKGSKQAIYMYDEFYGGASNKLQYLPLATVTKFVSSLCLQSDSILDNPLAIVHELGSIANKGTCTTSSKFKLNMAGRTSVVSFLLSHVVATDGTIPTFQTKLLDSMKSIHTSDYIAIVFPLVASNIKRVSNHGIPEQGDTFDTLIRVILGTCFSTHTAAKLTSEAGGSCWKSLISFIDGPDSVPAESFEDWPEELRTQAYLQQVVFEYLTPGFVSALGADEIAKITRCLCDVAIKGNAYSIPNVRNVSLRSLFSTLPFDVPTVAGILGDIAESIIRDDSDTARSAKRTRMTTKQKTALDVLPELSTLLEYLLCSSEISTSPIVAPQLFTLLSALVSDVTTSVAASTAGANGTEGGRTVQAQPVSVDYLKQLVLGMLTGIFDEANKTDTVIDESIIRVDVIVNAIRTSTSPQTHNQTLLLLAAVAIQHPQVVLHHVMAIFTFMGANVLRQDDEYSFHVIEQTLEKVIPPLVKSGSSDMKTKMEEIELTGPVLRVFVDALSHIPRHRRMTLFATLTRTMGVSKFGSTIISLLLERHTVRLLKNNKSQESIKDKDDIYAFALSLAHTFTPFDQITSVKQILLDISLLPAEKPSEGKGAKSTSSNMEPVELYIDVAHMNNKQIRTYRLVALDFIHRLLTSRQFETKFYAEIGAQGTKDLLSETAAAALALITNLGTQHDQLVSQQKLLTSASARIWKQTIYLSYNVLDDVNSLMDRRLFVNTVIMLLGQKDLKVRRKAMTLANNKILELDTQKLADDTEGVDMILILLDSICSIAKGTAEHGTGSLNDREVVANKQAALLCIATAAKKLTVLRPAKFTEITKEISGESCLGSSNPVVASSALVALSVLCMELGPRLIPSLPLYLPLVLKHLCSVTNRYKTANTDDLALLISALSAIESIVESTPAFLAPSLSPLFACLFNPDLHGSVSHDSDKSDTDGSDEEDAAEKTPKASGLDKLRGQVTVKVDSVLSALAKSIPPRQLLPAQFSYYQKEACKRGTAVVVPFIEFVGKTGGSIQRAQLLQFYKPLFKFFLGVFDLSRNPSIPVVEVDAIERASLDSFMRFVIKLTENLFKPLFLTFVEWATVDSAMLPAAPGGDWKALSKDEDEDELALRKQLGSEARLRVFYRVLNMLFGKLKSILTPYYSSVIDTSVKQLNKFGVTGDSIDRHEEKTRTETPVPSALWSNVVDSVYLCTLHDANGFWNEDTFGKIYHALANQLPNTKSAAGVADEQAYDDYIQRVRVSVAPAISQLAVAVGNDALWKQINQEVMMKSRSDDPAVRAGALVVLQALYQKLGEEFLILLPETIPYIAELLEDDDSRVERITQETIKVIESYLGESLQSYLH